MRIRLLALGAGLLLLLTGCAAEPSPITDAAGCGYEIDESAGLIVIAEDASSTEWLEGAVCVLDAVGMPDELRSDALTPRDGAGRHDVEWSGYAASYGREGDALVITVAQV